MTGNFEIYSKYYDLLYRDKDYTGEVKYVCNLLESYAIGPLGSLLELGSGTGVHAELISNRGIAVHGVELSETMLNAARQREKNSQSQLSFVQGDVRNFRDKRRFDAVISLFHVLSYQVSDIDLRGLLKTAAEHLKESGLFVFDFWYGPAVLWQRPSLRVKRMENEAISILRIAEPELHDAANVVDVKYTIFANDKNSDRIERIEERHRMRYLFLSELDLLLDQAGFSRLVAEEWMTGAAPTKDTWGVAVVARKN